MTEFLRGVGRMLRISWRADAARTVGALITASGQYIVLPLRAVGLALLADGAVSRDSGKAVTGAAVIVALSAANRLMAWASLNLRMRLREHTQLYLDTHLMALTAGTPGIAHHELPEYLDSMERLRAERPYLANPFNPISWTLASVLQLASVVVLLAGVRPILAALPLLGVPAAVATARAELAAVRLLDGQAEGSRALRHFFDLATEPGAAKEVRIFGLGEELSHRRSALFTSLETERLATSRRNVAVISVWWALFAVGYGGAVLSVADRARSGHASVGAVALVLALGAQLNSQLAELAGNVAWFSRSLRAARRLVWFTDYADEARQAVAPAAPASPPARLRSGIRFTSVDFAYPGSDRLILGGVDLSLPAGHTVAIVGENGAGKTTLVKLLARMYEPTAGHILIDDIDLAAIPVEEWRLCLSAGFQDFARLELVARQTVGAGDVCIEPSDAVVGAALDRAVAGSFVDTLPQGLDTQLGRGLGGSELSLGQWQKLALGRAMMRTSPLLLILDEPTASLDAPTEHALFERFTGAARSVAALTGGITILVSHRFSTVRMADTIVVINGGGIAEVGSHDELIAGGGLYSQLYRLQASAYR